MCRTVQRPPLSKAAVRTVQRLPSCTRQPSRPALAVLCSPAKAIHPAEPSSRLPIEIVLSRTAPSNVVESCRLALPPSSCSLQCRHACRQDSKFLTVGHEHSSTIDHAVRIVPLWIIRRLDVRWPPQKDGVRTPPGVARNRQSNRQEREPSLVWSSTLASRKEACEERHPRLEFTASLPPREGSSFGALVDEVEG